MVDERAPLTAYRDKRDPARTNEPFSAERLGSKGPTLRGEFVVHLHAATRRHYDVRLQVGATLKSFAVPRGPSLNPDDKRLAVNTEDHPLEYLDFEDVIPEGNYGAGAMIVWDRGQVIYLEGSAEEGIDRAKIDFELRGRKLRGRFGLIHTGARAKKPGEANHWLLVKKVDAFSSAERDIVAEEPHSVLSGLTVEQRADAPRVAEALVQRAAALGALKQAVDPAKLKPMLCATTGAELDDPERIYELKVDGVRIVADKSGDKVTLRYRSGRTADHVYPEVTRAVRALAPNHVVLDGEVVAFDEQGRPDFQRLSRRVQARRPRDVARAAIDVPVSYMVFDVLAIGDYDVRRLPLNQRKELLSELLPGRGIVRKLDHIEDGRALWAFCQQNGLEGLVAKVATSTYRSGPRRYRSWVKIKCMREDDFVIVGWEGGGGSGGFGALFLATYQDELVLRGKVGSGFSEPVVTPLLERLRELAVKRCPATGSVSAKKGEKRHWVKPELIARVAYLEFTSGGTLRHPSFRGLRTDVATTSCVAAPREESLDDRSTTPADDVAALRATDVAVRAVLSNQDKVFWPDEGYTKGDLCSYYASVASALLPFLAGRPIVLVRYPDGIDGKNFFQWNVPRGTPTWLRTMRMRDEGTRGSDGRTVKGERNAFLIDDIDGLLHIANLGCIPIHIVAAREGSMDACDFLTLDFDIGDQPFSHAVTLALSLKELLDDVGLVGFPKTSGQTGLHVLVPMGPGVSFPVAKMLVELLGRLLLSKHPDIATMERRVSARGPRVLIDIGQTGRARTIVAPYSVRAVRGATVSAPLSWNEVHRALDPARFTMFHVPALLTDTPCPMAELLEVRPDIAKAVANLERYAKYG